MWFSWIHRYYCRKTWAIFLSFFCRPNTEHKFSFIKYQINLLNIEFPGLAGFPVLGSAQPWFGDCHLVHCGRALLPLVLAEEWPREWKKLAHRSGIWLFWEAVPWEASATREHHSTSLGCMERRFTSRLPQGSWCHLCCSPFPSICSWIYRAAAPSAASQLDPGAFPPHPAVWVGLPAPPGATHR